MSKSGLIIKVMVNIIFILLFIGPLLYGLMNYNWNLNLFVKPSYSPPNVNFNTELKEINFIDNKLHILLYIENKGDINISITYLNASLYGSNGKYITNIRLEKPVEIYSNSTEDVDLYINLDSNAIRNIFESFAEGFKKFVIKGILGIKVFSSKVEYPLNMNINIPRETFIKYFKIGFSYQYAAYSNNILSLYVNISNPSQFKFNISGWDLKLYTPDDYEIGRSISKNICSIPSYGSSIIRLNFTISNESIYHLLKYFIASNSVDLSLKGYITVSYYGYKSNINISMVITLNRSIFTGLKK